VNEFSTQAGFSDGHETVVTTAGHIANSCFQKLRFPVVRSPRRFAERDRRVPQCARAEPAANI